MKIRLLLKKEISLHESSNVFMWNIIWNKRQYLILQLEIKYPSFFNVTLTVVVVVAVVDASRGEPVESCKRNKKTKHCVY